LVSDGEHYGVSKKTKYRKGEQMKRLALLSAVTMMLASAVFAPVAMAQEPGEVDVTSVTLGPGGSVTVTAEIQCVEGQVSNFANVTVRQRTSGNVFLIAGGGTDPQQLMCPTTGPLEFTFTAFGSVSGDGPQKPFHKGQAVVQTFGWLCPTDGSPCGPQQNGFEEVRIR
jgi:hypothetical protein